MEHPLRETVCAGPLALTCRWEDGGLAGLTLGWSEACGPDPHPGPQPSTRMSPGGRALARALAAYVEEGRTDWPDPDTVLGIDLSGHTAFSRDVLEALRREVGPGERVTYGQLARMAGRPGAARAVGRVMAANRWPLLIPCHRVVGAGGGLTGFSGAGLPMKRYLLELEAKAGAASSHCM